MMYNPSATVKFGNKTVRPQTAAPAILNPEEIAMPMPKIIELNEATNHPKRSAQPV